MKNFKACFFVLCLICCAATGVRAQQPRYDLISGFYQDQVFQDEVLNRCMKDETWGNCVTIATIKAAIATFGSVKGIYKKYTWEGDVLKLTFDDGVSVTLSSGEITQAKQAFGVLPGNGYPHLDSAVQVYASICKRALLRKNLYGDKGACVQSFHDALGLINSGMPTSGAGELLGLELKPIKTRTLKQTPSAIINSSAHAAFCTYGYQDIDGEKYKVKTGLVTWMKNPIGLGGPIFGAYVLTKHR